jgi:hypothetical protein
MNDEPKPLVLGYDERQAIATLRKFIQRKPEHTAAVFKAILPADAGKEIVVGMLLASKAQLNSILVVTQEMMALAKHFADSEQTKEEA